MPYEPNKQYLRFIDFKHYLRSKHAGMMLKYCIIYSENRLIAY